MLNYETYAENIRVTAMTKENAQRRPLHIRELARMSGFSYEHIRKLWMGKYTERQKFSVSQDCNRILCEILGLNEVEMWKLAQQEKYANKMGYAPMQLEDPEGQEMSELWDQLDPRQHATLLEIARSMTVAASLSSR